MVEWATSRLVDPSWKAVAEACRANGVDWVSVDAMGATPATGIVRSGSVWK